MHIVLNLVLRRGVFAFDRVDIYVMSGRFLSMNNDCLLFRPRVCCPYTRHRQWWVPYVSHLIVDMHHTCIYLKSCGSLPVNFLMFSFTSFSLSFAFSISCCRIVIPRISAILMCRSKLSNYHKQAHDIENRTIKSSQSQCAVTSEKANIHVYINLKDREHRLGNLKYTLQI